MDGSKTYSNDNKDHQADLACDAEEADEKDWPVDTGWAWVILFGKMMRYTRLQVLILLFTA